MAAFSAVVQVWPEKFKSKNPAVRLRLTKESGSTRALIVCTSVAQIVALWVISVLACLKYGSQR